MYKTCITCFVLHKLNKKWCSMKEVSNKIKDNEKYINDHFKDVGAFVERIIKCGAKKVYVYFLQGASDEQYIAENIIKPIQSGDIELTLENVKESTLSASEVEVEFDLDKGIDEIMQGKCLLLFEKCEKFLLVSTDNFPSRAVEEPPTNTVLQGPRVGFVESCKTNMALISKILATSHLKSEKLVVGRYTKTNVVIMYIDDICDLKLVKQVKNRIKRIDIDGIIDSYYISSFLEEHPESFFKQIGNAEKPDIVSAKLLEGRLCIIVDGSPMVLTLPYMLFEDVQKSEDYYNSGLRATLLRWLRLFSIFTTLMLPGLYISVQLYHYKVIPLTFLITVVNSTQGIPLSPFAEILFVLVLFEILYEASLRMPKYLGMAMSIVGALILGDTAVKAGLISPPAVMIVALSGITLYTIPEQISVMSLLRIVYTFAGGMLGFYGMILFTLYLLFYLNDFDNYGVAYFAPFAPRVSSDYKDAFFKSNVMHMKTRPKSIKNKNTRRQK